MLSRNKSPDPAAQITALTSWKEIARYVGKGVRTVQRWEKERGLPVRRIYPSSRSTVLAFPDEITSWARHKNISDRHPRLHNVGKLLFKIERLEEQLRVLLELTNLPPIAQPHPTLVTPRLTGSSGPTSLFR